jgi:hypothetical protein
MKSSLVLKLDKSEKHWIKLRHKYLKSFELTKVHVTVCSAKLALKFDKNYK